MPEVTLKPEGQEPQAATPTQASKNFMGRVSDRIGNFIANESLIPYGATILTLVTGIKGLVEFAGGHYAAALNEGTIAGISVMIASQTLEKSPAAPLIRKLGKTIAEGVRQSYRDSSNKNK